MTTLPAPVAELIGEGHALLRVGQRERARTLLIQAVRADPSSEQAWLLLAGAVTDAAQRRDCLERVLRLNPANTIAAKALALLPTVASPAPAPSAVETPRPEPLPAQQEPQQAPLAPSTAGASPAAVVPAAPVHVSRLERLQKPSFGAPAGTAASAPARAPLLGRLQKPGGASARAVETIPLERPAAQSADAVTIALSEAAAKRARTRRRLWIGLLALSLALLLIGLVLVGIVLAG